MAEKSYAARLQAKVGPLPVWGWAVVILGAAFLYLRVARKSSASTPITSSDASGANNPPASGQGTPADQTTQDLLSQLLAGQDALLASLQSTTGRGAAGGDAGSSVAAASVASAAAPNNAPPSAAAPDGPAAAPVLVPPSGAPGTPAYVAATTGTPIVYPAGDPSASPLVGIDARMAHPSPATLAAGAKIATSQAETYAHQATVAAQGYHTAGF